MKTISVYGGYWIEGELVGIAYRNMLDPSTTSGIHVASIKHRALPMKECPMYIKL